jgi:hypothetical protein
MAISGNFKMSGRDYSAKGSGSGSSTQKRRVEEVKKQQQQQSIDARKKAAQSMKSSGLTSLGGGNVEQRRKTSGFDPSQYPSGVLTETQADGGQQKTYNVLDPNKARTVTTQQPTTTGTDTGTDTDDDDDKNYTDYEYYFDANGKLDLRKVRNNIGYFQQLTGRKIAKITPDGQIVFADETGGTLPVMQAMDKLSRMADDFVGFRPDKAFDTDNANTAATFAKMFGDMNKEEFNMFLNRKGNLDRILEYGANLPRDEQDKFQALIKSGDPQALANKFMQTGKAIDADKFQSYYDKIANPEIYYSDPKNVPQTSGGLADLASLDASQFSGDFANKIFAAREQLSRQGKNPFTGNSEQSGGGGGGDFQTNTGADTDTGAGANVPTPDFLLKRQYMPGFTPSYLGGPEQMQVAGGYYDPVTKKFIGNPYGTASQYQFAQGGIVGTSPLLFKNQGGMASNSGIKSFKNYGY